MHYSPLDQESKNAIVANLFLNVNDHSANFFIQHIRRKLSVLERPLTTARGDGKSYIYSNFNPKYAQMATTYSPNLLQLLSAL